MGLTFFWKSFYPFASLIRGIVNCSWDSPISLIYSFRCTWFTCTSEPPFSWIYSVLVHVKRIVGLTFFFEFIVFGVLNLFVHRNHLFLKFYSVLIHVKQIVGLTYFFKFIVFGVLDLFVHRNHLFLLFTFVNYLLIYYSVFSCGVPQR